ncbi:hypothetical protein DSLASN_07650 [Desulfoluna limicola]|uniref:Uncharacterized protein n=1 Tax=Desulfoluna limicola TaxID=2810562 RepID=A0ABM7PD77_9BACT|nr:hypothetical protein DSLASN_07650 [Desulfoluna limicola]
MALLSLKRYDYILLNIVIGLNHLFEWGLKDEIDISFKLDCVKGFNQLSLILE